MPETIKNRLPAAGKYVLFFFGALVIGIVFREELRSLFGPDPVRGFVYETSFTPGSVKKDTHISLLEGFITHRQGLQLAPGSAGRAVLSFNKKAHTGCLLRIWFYGDDGKKRPNGTGLSVDGGRTFTEIAGSGNYVGAVFDLSSRVRGSTDFKLQFVSRNEGAYTTPVFDKVQLIIPEGPAAKPALPDMTMIFLLFTLLFVVCHCLYAKELFSRTTAAMILFAGILFFAADVRWNELVRVSGAMLGPDARGYAQYAQKMALFSDHGFYSAQFATREPLYIFVVKVFFSVFGTADTHLRFTSCVFSLAVVYLTFKIGNRWFNSVTGLVAAFIAAVHPYLVELSPQGLRGECFTTLVLLFIYVGYVKKNMPVSTRTVFAGILAGFVLLVRSESLFMIAVIVLALPFFAPGRWRFARAVLVLIIGLALLAPHLFSTYQRHGDPFYAAHMHMRFYRNLEFMGKPGFPTQKEIMEKGMYTGPEVTPIEYYFKLHTPWQVLEYSAKGFAKIHLTMLLYPAFGKGNLREIQSGMAGLKSDFTIKNLLTLSRLLMLMAINDFRDYLAAFMLVTFFCAGLVFAACRGCWMLFVLLLAFQIQTSFVAYIGLDPRLSIHSYPLMALCCGYAVSCMLQQTSLPREIEFFEF